jgi:hypothetical protein
VQGVLEHGWCVRRTIPQQQAAMIIGAFRLGIFVERLRLHRRQSMSKKAAESHKKVSEHLTHAARHHTEAAKHHETGQHEKAAHHAHVARAHATLAREHSENAAKAHLEEHGKK